MKAPPGRSALRKHVRARSGHPAVGRLRWAAIAASVMLVLAGCGGGAAGTVRSAPNATAIPVQPNGTQRCTEVYCVPQAVPRGPANGLRPKAPAFQPADPQRCTEVYCVPQTVPRNASTP
jgi:hypothetical protein